ncbi:NAD-dependent epimerase/dehydratase family protein [Micromonospora zhanjiangensis]
MTGSAFVLGAAGQVGTAVVANLVEHGWRVTAGGRRPRDWPDGVRGAPVDRDDDVSLAEALAGGYDVLVDCVAYTEEHGRQLARLTDRVGSAVVLSSFSVYADEHGRTLDESTGPDDFPALPVPVPETHRTVPPGDSTYSTRKVALENVLLDSGLPVTVLRPGAIAGRHSAFPGSGTSSAGRWTGAPRWCSTTAARAASTPPVRRISRNWSGWPRSGPATGCSTPWTPRRSACGRSPRRSTNSSTTGPRRSCCPGPARTVSARRRGRCPARTCWT